MAPGGATPDGALGYVAAGLELASQIARGELLPPRALYVAVGSTGTAAGLLVGLLQAARLGLGPSVPPRVVAVRIAPWPVTSRKRILGLATRASRRLAELAGDPSLALAASEIGGHLSVDGEELGPGYGFPTRAGLAAIDLFERAGLRLDPTYSAKAAAAFLRAAGAGEPGPLLFWSTKSSAALPTVAANQGGAPRWQAWLRAAEQQLARAQILV
jgi:D-cysteine desulfhydrase